MTDQKRLIKYISNRHVGFQSLFIFLMSVIFGFVQMHDLIIKYHIFKQYNTKVIKSIFQK